MCTNGLEGTSLPQCTRPLSPACLTSSQAKAPCNSTCFHLIYFPLSYILASCPTSVSASSYREKHSLLTPSRLLQLQDWWIHKKAVQCPWTARSEDAEGQSSRYLLILHQHPPSPPITLLPPLASCRGPTATLWTSHALTACVHTRAPQILLRLSACTRDWGCFPRFWNNSMQNTPRYDLQRNLLPSFSLHPAVWIQSLQVWKNKGLHRDAGITEGKITRCLQHFPGHCYSAFCFHECCIPWQGLKSIFLPTVLTCQSMDVTCSLVTQAAQIHFAGNTILKAVSSHLPRKLTTTWAPLLPRIVSPVKSFRQVKWKEPQPQGKANPKHC